MSLIKLYRTLAGGRRIMIAVSIALSAITILSSIGLLTLSAYIISFCALQPSIADISVAVVGVRFFGLSRGIFRYLERLISHNTTFSALSSLRIWLYKRIESMDIYTYNLMDKKDVFTRVIDDIEILQEFYLRTFSPYTTAIIIGGTGIFILHYFGIYLAAAFSLFYIIVVLIMPVILWYCTKGMHKQLAKASAEEKVKLLDLVEGLGEILGNSALELWQSNLGKLYSQKETIQRKLALWKCFTSGALMLLTNAAMIACAVIAGSMVSSGRLRGVYIAAIVLCVSSLFEAVQNIPAMLQKIEQSQSAADRIFEIANGREESISNKEAYKGAADDIERELRASELVLSMRNIAFRYPGQERFVLNNISLDCQTGKRVAIVGASGSGKSTLSYILLGWLKNEAGSVKINGIPMDKIPEEVLSELFSVVNQDIYFFNTSIRNNVILGKPSATNEEIERAFSIAGLSEFIASLPGGYDTEIGESGMKLSGGERQRLALARAYLKKSRIMILDEPAAGLDIATEKRVLDSFYSSTKDRALIVITHRLVSMEAMDEILVFDRGLVIERGTHQELLKARGRYHKLWTLQQQYLDIQD